MMPTGEIKENPLARRNIEAAYLRGFISVGLFGIGLCWALWHFVLSHVHLVWR